MRLKTAKDATDATDACQEQLIRGGFEADKYSSCWLKMRLGGDKPGVVYDVWFPKGTVPGYKDDGWDSSSTIILTFV